MRDAESLARDTERAASALSEAMNKLRSALLDEQHPLNKAGYDALVSASEVRLVLEPIEAAIEAAAGVGIGEVEIAVGGNGRATEAVIRLLREGGYDVEEQETGSLLVRWSP